MQILCFGYGDNFVELTCNSSVMPANLNDIKIFCPPDEDDFIRLWANRFEQIKKIIPYNQLDQELLLFGIKYIREVRSHYRHNQVVFNFLNEGYKGMCAALAASYQ
jgi:hypothetical protein